MTSRETQEFSSASKILKCYLPKLHYFLVSCKAQILRLVHVDRRKVSLTCSEQNRHNTRRGRQRYDVEQE